MDLSSDLIPKMDDCLASMWNIKYKGLEENSSEAAKSLVAQLAESRFNFGNAYHSQIGGYEKVQTLYDMIKGYQVVLKQHDKAKRFAKELVDYVVANPEYAHLCYKLTKVRVNHQFNKEKLASKIIKSCKQRDVSDC